MRVFVLGLTLAVTLGVSPLAQAQSASQSATQSATQSPAARRAALTALFNEIWEDGLKRNPGFASSLGDRRYNDQLSDNSPRALNDELARQRVFLTRLIAIDTTGLTAQEKLSSELMQRELLEDEEAAQFKQWQMPVNQFHGIHTDLPSEITNWPFETTKDYDDYITRLKTIPRVMRQATENMQSGIAEGRVQPAYLMEKVLKQTEELATQSPEKSPSPPPSKSSPLPSLILTASASPPTSSKPSPPTCYPPTSASPTS